MKKEIIYFSYVWFEKIWYYLKFRTLSCMTDLSEMKKMDNRIDIANFIIHDKMSSKINHILNKKNLKCSESENFDEDDLDERKSVEEKSYSTYLSLHEILFKWEGWTKYYRVNWKISIVNRTIAIVIND